MKTTTFHEARAMARVLAAAGGYYVAGGGNAPDGAGYIFWRACEMLASSSIVLDEHDAARWMEFWQARDMGSQVAAQLRRPRTAYDAPYF